MDARTSRRVLVIGFGNPIRGDDGLGPALVERLDALSLAGVTTESDYQLTLEHAALVAEHDIVVFADAARDAGCLPFYFRPLEPSSETRGSTHAVSPGQVLAIAQACFGASPRAYVLGIRAHRLDDLVERLSFEAKQDLEAALRHLVHFVSGLPTAA